MQGERAQPLYYRAALRMLQFVEDRRPTGRRFGAEADATWKAFRGDLGASARIDLLLRDADAEWPGAFGAQAVFALTALAADEPFGAAWESLDDVDAEDLWRTLPDAPSSPAEALAAIAGAWELTIARHEPGAVAAADQLIVAGPGAIAAAIGAFAGASDLDWAEQITVIATPPAHRQLAAAGAALVNAPRATRLFTHADAIAIAPGARLAISDDADPADAAAARALVEG